MYNTDRPTIDKINQVIEDYFTTNPTVTIVPVKALMPSFIAARIFAKDRKNGAPIRSILKNLDRSNELELIPFVYAERHVDATYWYFIPSNSPTPTRLYKQEEKKGKTKVDEYISSDKSYVINLCDKVTGMKANRTKRFDFLLGDLHKDGVSQTKLPIDAYYDILQLVIQYNDIKPWEQAVPDYEKSDVFNEEENEDDGYKPTTKRNITREEQRSIYNERRAKIFPKHEIDFVLISYSDFKHDAALKIIRNEESDFNIVRKALNEFITPE